MKRFFALYRRLFIVGASLSLFLLIPAEWLYHIDSYLMYMTYREMIADTGLLMLLSGATWAIVTLLLSALVTTTPRRWRLDSLIFALFLCIGSVVGAILFLYTLVMWLKDVTGVHFRISRVAWGQPLAVAVLLAIVVSLLAIIRAKGLNALLAAAEQRLPGLSRACGVAFLAATAATLSGHFSLHDYDRVRPSQAISDAGNTPNIFLISIDTLSAEDMSLYGYALRTSPCMERFAEVADVFDHAYATSNLTTPGVTSILTGKYPLSHHVFHLYGYLRDKAQQETLPRILKTHGYTTAAVVSSPWAHPLHLRIEDDFDYLPAPPRSDSMSLSAPATLLNVRNSNLTADINEWGAPFQYAILQLPWERWRNESTGVPPKRVFDRALAFLDHARRQGPVFVWTHISPPHAPYLPDVPFKYSFLHERVLDSATAQRHLDGDYPPELQPTIDRLRLRYDEHIAYADQQVGAYLDALEARGYMDNSLIIITADHGESFEKGYQSHAGEFLYQPVIHIPLLIHRPGQTRGRRIGYNASQVDLAPTILDLLDLARPAWMDGDTLLPSLTGAASAARPKFSMNLEHASTFNAPKNGSFAVVEGPFKYIYYQKSSRGELFNLQIDPLEAHNLVGDDAETAGRMQQQISQLLLSGIPLRSARR